MSSESCHTPPSREGLQVEAARIELFKAIEDLRAITEKVAERLAPVRDLNKPTKAAGCDKAAIPPVCSHALELLDAASRVMNVRDILEEVFRDLQI